MWQLAVVHGPKVKRKFSCWKKKFEELLFEVLPDEAVDDKVDGGVEHERQLVDGGDGQPELPGEKNSSYKAIQSCTCFFFFMRPVIKVHVVDAFVDYPWSVADEED